MVAENRDMTNANKLSDGLLPTWRTCPFCGSENTRAVVGLVNACYLAGVILTLLVQFILSCFIAMDHEGSPLTFKRRCRKCNAQFRPKPVRDLSINCGQCGYDLTGNVSGVCPECGWRIPPEIIASIKKARTNIEVKQP
jgi:hypothetical protein